METIDKLILEEMLRNNPIIFNKYMIKTQIGKGSFGVVYLGEKIISEEKEEVALKFERKNKQKEYLRTEASILNELKGVGIPELISFGISRGFYVLIETFLGNSLLSIFNKKYLKKIPLQDLCKIYLQIIDRIQWVHSKNYIHRDLKPDNFLFGKKDKNVIYLIDFGLSTKYLSSIKNNHIKQNKTNRLIGCNAFRSRNAEKGEELSRRDDIESLAYIMIYLMNDGKLPWTELKNYNIEEKIIKRREEKKNIMKSIFFTRLPDQLKQFIEYSLNLGFEEKPDYYYLKKLLKDLHARACSLDNLSYFDLETFSELVKPRQNSKKKSPQLKILQSIEARLQNKQKRQNNEKEEINKLSLSIPRHVNQENEKNEYYDIPAVSEAMKINRININSGICGIVGHQKSKRNLRNNNDMKNNNNINNNHNIINSEINNNFQNINFEKEYYYEKKYINRRKSPENNNNFNYEKINDIHHNDKKLRSNYNIPLQMVSSYSINESKRNIKKYQRNINEINEINKRDICNKVDLNLKQHLIQNKNNNYENRVNKLVKNKYNPDNYEKGNKIVLTQRKKRVIDSTKNSSINNTNYKSFGDMDNESNLMNSNSIKTKITLYFPNLKERINNNILKRKMKSNKEKINNFYNNCEISPIQTEYNIQNSFYKKIQNNFNDNFQKKEITYNNYYLNNKYSTNNSPHQAKNSYYFSVKSNNIKNTNCNSNNKKKIENNENEYIYRGQNVFINNGLVNNLTQTNAMYQKFKYNLNSPYKTGSKYKIKQNNIKSNSENNKIKNKNIYNYENIPYNKYNA